MSTHFIFCFWNIIKFIEIIGFFYLHSGATWEKKQYKSTTLEIVSSVEQSGICINRKFKLFYENNKLICSKCCCLLLSSKNNTAFYILKVNTSLMQIIFSNLFKSFFVRQTKTRRFFSWSSKLISFSIYAQKCEFIKTF